jgi:hypothetical protein
MRHVLDYLRWRFGSRGRGPLAYRMLAGVLVESERLRRPL